MCIAKYSIGKVQEATSILKALKFHVPRLPRPESSASFEKYTTLWTFRGIMLLRMEQAGMKSLLVGDMDLDQFVSMNPDESGNLEKLRTANRDTVDTVQQLVALCDYPTPRALVHGVLFRRGHLLGLCGH